MSRQLQSATGGGSYAELRIPGHRTRALSTTPAPEPLQRILDDLNTAVQGVDVLDPADR